MGAELAGELIADPAEAGRVVLCFQPRMPVPPDLEQVAGVLLEADRALAVLDQALDSLPVPGVIGRLLARFDAVHSSGAEGTTTTFTELLQDEAGKAPPAPDDAAQVLAAADGFTAAAGARSDLVASALAAHASIGRHDAGRFTTPPGTFRQTRASTPDPDFANGLFSYAAPSGLTALMDDWRAFSMTADGTPELVRQVLGHWAFEHIQPFPDGNGRVGRLLLPIACALKGATRHPVAFVGEAVRQDKMLYIAGLKRARQTGDWTDWTRLMLAFVARCAQQNLARVETIGALRTSMHEAFARHRSDAAIHALADWTVVHPTFTARQAQAGLGRSYPAVNAAIAELVQRGFATAGDGRRDRLFELPAIMQAFELPPQRPVPGGTRRAPWSL
jgi:Fic family protein